MNRDKQDRVSVEKAYKWGEICLLTVPVYMMLSSVMLCFLYFRDNLIYCALLLIVPFLYRSIVSTFWYVWAFSHVRNTRQLMEKALYERILFRRGHWLERMEFRTCKQKQLVREIEEKLSIPDETNGTELYQDAIVIGFSAHKVGFNIAIITLSILGGFLFLYEKTYLISLILLGGGLCYFCLWWDKSKLKSWKHQLRIDNKGIYSAEYGFVPWEQIGGGSVYIHESRSIGSSFTYKIAMLGYLRMLPPGEKPVRLTRKQKMDRDRQEVLEQISVDELAIIPEELQRIVEVFKVRYRESVSGKK